uniref:ZP domain-containing protein n=1 Tax=Panagrellus redivivus TaxID=6233 RepID=A0A7E4UYG4_PANRE
MSLRRVPDSFSSFRMNHTKLCFPSNVVMALIFRPPSILILFACIISVISTDTSGFNPTVEWTCEADSINVAIRTSTNFSGIAYARDHANTCNATGNGGTVQRFKLAFDTDGLRCGFKTDTDTETVSLQLEVHEHKLLILQQDRVFNISCSRKSVALKVGDNDGVRLVKEPGLESNDTVANSTMADLPVLSFSRDNDVEFELALIPSKTDSESPENTNALSTGQLGFGMSYDLRASIKNSDDRLEFGERFRVSHCAVSSEDITVQLMDNHGCSIDNKLITDFVYKKGVAVARIPSMFQFPNSKIVKFECKFFICEDVGTICHPLCVRKFDDPIAEVEDAQLIAQLLSVADDAQEVVETTTMEEASFEDEFGGRSSATVVHVMDRRETMQLNDDPIMSTSATVAGIHPVSNCVLPEDIIHLQAAIGVLSLILVIGLTVCTIIQCRNCCPKKRIPSSRSNSHGPDQYWITQPTESHHDYINDPVPFTPYNDFPDAHRNSVTSLISLKQRLMHESTSSPTSFRPTPIIRPPTIIPYGFTESGSRQNSTFGQSESTSGASTWHESPDHSRLENNHRESYSIL